MTSSHSLSAALGQQHDPEPPAFTHRLTTRPNSSLTASASQSTSFADQTWSLPTFTHNYAQKHQSLAPAPPSSSLRRSSSDFPPNFTSNVTMSNNNPASFQALATGASRAYVPPSVPFPPPPSHPLQPAASLAVTATDEHTELLKGLMDSFKSYKKLVEGENRRRQSWEQGREAVLVARQTTLERQIAEMQREIEMLKDASAQAPRINIEEKMNECVDSNDPLRNTTLRLPSPTPSTNSTPVYPITPITPISLPLTSGGGFSFAQKHTKAEDVGAGDFQQGSSRQEAPVQVPNVVEAKKRSRPPSPVHEEGAESVKLRKLAVNNIQTIQGAIRNHILHCMDVFSEKALPPSHDENVPLQPSSPVRFVWAKTTKKSVHNTRMKDRVLADLNERRAMYPLIPDREFSKARLETAYEQAYSTLRTKFMTQKPMEDKPLKGKPVSKPPKGKTKKSEDPKVVRQRRISRKKLKLTRRIAVRETMDEYSDAIYDAAFTLPCMSSDESGSESEDFPTFSVSSARFLRSRYPAWRSQRLHALYQSVDAKDSAARSEKPQRGMQRLDRRQGEAKGESDPPPPGAPRWMVSKRWLRETGMGEVKLEVDEEEGMDGERASALALLGEESEDE